MPYVSQLDVEAFTGFGYNDMMQGGKAMTQNQWSNYCTEDLIPRIEQMVHRFCGVASFFEHTVVELHNSPGEMDYLNDYMSWMTPGGPGVEVTEVPEIVLAENCISVASVEFRPDQWIENWIPMIRVGSQGGDWREETMDEMTHIYLNSLPPKGKANIRITYQAGYPIGSPQLQEIALIVLRIIRINIEEKLKFQQAGLVRNTNVRDYMPMYDINKERHKDQYYIPDDIRNELKRYQRILISQGL